MRAPPPTEGGEVAAALLVGGELFGGRGPRAGAISEPTQDFPDRTSPGAGAVSREPGSALDRVFIHFRPPNRSRTVRTRTLN